MAIDFEYDQLSVLENISIGQTLKRSSQSYHKEAEINLKFQG